MLFCQWSQNILWNSALAKLPGRPFDLRGSSCLSVTAGYRNSFKAESEIPESEASELGREWSSRKERSHNREGFLMFVHKPTKTSCFTRGEWQQQPLCIDMSAIVAFLCRGCETGCWAERVLLFVGLILIVLLLSAFDESKQEIAPA